MDIGVISVRYARALLKASTEAKVEEKVYAEMQKLANTYIAVPELRRTLDSPMLPRDKKADLLLAAIGTECNELTKRFIQLVLNEGRENVVQFIANSYLTLYRQQKNITLGKLITAIPVTSDIEQRMKKMVESRTNGVVEFTTEVDKEIIGGFILEYDTYRMDTSVKAQLNNILKQLN